MTWRNPDRTTSWSSAIRIRIIGETPDELLQPKGISPSRHHNNVDKFNYPTRGSLHPGQTRPARLASVWQLPRVERTSPPMRCRRRGLMGVDRERVLEISL